MSQAIEFLFKVCYTDEKPEDIYQGRIAVPPHALQRSTVLYQYLALNPMGELVWHDCSEFGPPPAVLRRLAEVLLARALVGSSYLAQHGIEVKETSSKLSINLGTLFVDRPED